MSTDRTAVLVLTPVVRVTSPIIVAPAPAPMPIQNRYDTSLHTYCMVNIPTTNLLPKIMYLWTEVKYMKFPAIFIMKQFQFLADSASSLCSMVPEVVFIG